MQKASSNSLVLQTSPQRSSRMPRNRKSKLRAEMTVRLSIVYGSLKISSVRSAFHESLGVKKYKGAEDKQLLQSFTSLFKDDIQLPSGTTIEVSRLPGHQLKMRINEQGLGSVESELLWRCFFDLYIGDEPFDKSGRAAMAALLLKTRHGCILDVEKRISSTLLETDSHIGCARTLVKSHSGALRCNMQSVEFGKYELDAWYFSPYPEDYINEQKLYMKRKVTIERHKMKCNGK